MTETSEPLTPKSRPLDELFRRALGRQLRELRLARGERLDDTASRAGISPQYLSEVERGRKDASSEMIGAIVGALESRLADILLSVADDLSTGRASAPVIDIRSTTSRGGSRTRSGAGGGASFDVSVSVAVMAIAA
ncbi:helix-turn-helix domain-containing protein [Subtercola sp. YIM 133946]|uniref:helix-turn-helix domain-containing protein n=1 Tax=Subtercola sp. YIM 133946 TaxID=3118909 RepID=UPI002F946DE4